MLHNCRFLDAQVVPLYFIYFVDCHFAEQKSKNEKKIQHERKDKMKNKNFKQKKKQHNTKNITKMNGRLPESTIP
jgi:hypothetical protein